MSHSLIVKCSGNRRTNSSGLSNRSQNIAQLMRAVSRLSPSMGWREDRRQALGKYRPALVRRFDRQYVDAARGHRSSNVTPALGYVKNVRGCVVPTHAKAIGLPTHVDGTDAPTSEPLLFRPKVVHYRPSDGDTPKAGKLSCHHRWSDAALHGAGGSADSRPGQSAFSSSSGSSGRARNGRILSTISSSGPLLANVMGRRQPFLGSSSNHRRIVARVFPLGYPTL